MSLIEVSPTTRQLQVTHTLSAHDMEGILGAGAVDLSWFETPQAQASLRTYCLDKFTIADQTGRPLALSFVGVELRGDIIHVYFDAPRYRGTSIMVDSNFLQDVSETQLNRVNVRARGRVHFVT